MEGMHWLLAAWPLGRGQEALADTGEPPGPSAGPTLCPVWLGYPPFHACILGQLFPFRQH